MAVMLFRGAVGINNVDDPTELSFNPENGLAELAVGLNVDISKKYKVSRRKGYRQIDPSSYHNFINIDDEFCICTLNSPISQWSVVLPDGTINQLHSLVGGHYRISYQRIQNKLYWMNGNAKGIIDLGLYLSNTALALGLWEYDGNYIGPSTQKSLFGPPTGHLMAVFRGRMYVAEGPNLWYSEPYAYSQFRLARNYVPFESKIKMIKPVESGVFVSTKHKVYFLRGLVPKDFMFEDITSYPAVEFTDRYIEGDTLNVEIVGPGVEGKVVIWGSTKGICLGLPNGNFRNLTRKQIIYDATAKGAATVVGDRYICVT